MLTLTTILIVLAFLCAGAGVFNANFGARTPNWVALALAFWFASLLVRG